jgi:hypothetical protein
MATDQAVYMLDLNFLEKEKTGAKFARNPGVWKRRRFSSLSAPQRYSPKKLN